jgi:hypothetical protein
LKVCDFYLLSPKMHRIVLLLCVLSLTKVDIVAGELLTVGGLQENPSHHAGGFWMSCNSQDSVGDIGDLKTTGENEWLRALNARDSCISLFESL